MAMALDSAKPLSLSDIVAVQPARFILLLDDVVCIREPYGICSLVEAMVERRVTTSSISRRCPPRSKVQGRVVGHLLLHLEGLGSDSLR
jgi:hypothetical protein